MSQVQAFDYSLDLLRTLLWQYGDAANLQQLMQYKQDFWDENHDQFWTDWQVDVFDLKTANEFGLSVWAQILDFPLFGTTNVSPSNYLAFGFDTGEGFPATSPIRAFGDPNGGNFAVDSRNLFGLPTLQKRILLCLRMFQTFTRASVPEINRFLLSIFGPNEIYVLDNLDMTIDYVLTGPISKEMQPVLESTDVLPRPAGVGIQDYTFGGVEAWGFGITGGDPLDGFNTNFRNGSFISG